MQQRKMSFWFLYVVAVLALAYGGFAITLYIRQPKFLYNPVRDVVYTPEELGLEFEDVFFKSADGVRLNGWYVPSDRPGFTVLFCHGNGGNIMHRLDSIEMFHQMGLGCFVFDYRGYGKSGGVPEEEGTYRDAQAAYKWLTDKKAVPADQIIILGRSLGGSIAAHLAANVDTAGLVVESAFTSYADIGRKFYPYLPVRWFARFNYSTVDYIKNVHCPVLLIYSRTDELIPFEFGLEIYEVAKEPKDLVELFGSHNDFFLVSSEAYKKAWLAWLDFIIAQNVAAPQEAGSGR